MTRLWQQRPVRWLLALIVAAGLFFLGWGFGDGRIGLPAGGLASQNPGLPNTLNYSSVTQVYQILRNDYDGHLTTTQLLNGLKTGLAQATGDPYTEYFTPAQAAQFNNELQGTFSGIGAELSQDTSGNIIVIAPIAGTPAAKAGLQAQDVITAINGVSTSGMNVDTAVTKIRGPAGTKVTLGILRGGQTALSLTITRANITVPSVNSQILPGNIGYMSISQFSSDTGSLAQAAAEKFKAANVKGIILDLRDNPGGEVNAAIEVSSLWLPSGQLIMQEKRGSEVMQTYTSLGNDILHGIPTVVLINGGTASAAEITTGALHDNHDAYVIGTKSFGKGVVQEVDNLPGGAELKVTIASWYRPDGKNINHIGITPDQIVKEPTSGTITINNDPQLLAAEKYLTKN